MTVAELLAALTDFDPDLPVKLRAYCCPEFHSVKVEFMYAEGPEVQPPTVACVVISDAGIRWRDTPEDR